MPSKLWFRYLLILLLGLVLSFTGHPWAGSTSDGRGSPPSNTVAELVQTGKRNYDSGKFTAAVSNLEQAARLAATRGDRVQQAQALGFTALAYQKLGQWQAAEATIAASLSLLGAAPVDSVLVRAQVLNAQAHLQLAQGDAETAIETWRAAETAYARAGDAMGVTGSQINQTQALQSLGFYRRAEKQLTRAEAQIQNLPDSPVKLIGLQNLGNLRRRGGELPQAKALLAQSLAMAQRLNLLAEQSQVWLNLGNTERAIGQRFQELAQDTQAQQATLAALKAYQQAATLAPTTLGRTQANLNRLSLLIEIGQLTEVEALRTDLEVAINQLPASRPAIYATINLAQSLLRLESITPAADPKALPSSPDASISTLLGQAIRQATDLQDLRAESAALGMLGQWQEHRQQWQEAERLTRQALSLAQGIAASDLTYQWQWQLGRSLQAQAEHRGSRRADRQAIAYYSSALKVLNGLRSDLAALNPDIQLSFRERVEPVYRELVDLLLRSESPSQADLQQARNVMEALQLAELDNFFRDACAQPEAVNIDTLDPQAAIVYPILLSDRLEVIVKLPGQQELRRYSQAGVSSQNVDEAVERVRLSLRRRSTSLSQIKRESNQIYTWLLKPFETELESALDRSQSQIKTLVFVLDGSLRNLPPAMLYDGNRYLVERYAIALTPGLQLLEPQPLQRSALNVLIAGASNAPSFRSEGLGPIDNVEAELLGIAQQVNRSEKLKNQEFLEATVKRQVSSASFNVVHIATHGRFSSNPEQTFILDWNQRIQVRDLDTLLRTNDINRTSTVELLILSACETATGDRRAALGLAGVAIRAGAQSTMATLYQVNDASTAELMIRFYQQLSQPQLTKAEALRNAQLAFLSEYPDTDYNRPYHWASFILVGNWL